MVQVRPGAESWSAAGGDVGALVLHGFSGSPAGVRPLAAHLAGAGYAVEVPRLPGHGTHWRDLQRSTWRDWAREAIAAFETLRARTHSRVVVGQSLGGALALHLAATRGEDIAGVVLINPWVGPLVRLNALGPILPALKWVLPSIPGIGNDIARPGQDELCYDRVGLKAAASVQRFFALVRRDLGQVRVPLLVFTSRHDHVVDPANGELILSAVASTDTRQVWLERSFHVAALDYDAEEIATLTAQFTKRVTA